MSKLKHVEFTHFRNLNSTSILPSPSLNLIYGSNGSGKSSLLEAIYFIATGSSFRTHKLTNIINNEADCFTLFAEITNVYDHRVGIKRCKDLKHQTRINGSDIIRRSELIRTLPIQVLSPESINILLQGSDIRRSFIDWALFHVEHSFHFHITHYNKALKQRNALLKGNDLQQLPYWNALLVEHGEVINRLRYEYTEKLFNPLNDFLKKLLPELKLEVSYRSGWNRESDLLSSLDSALENDIKLKHTTVGPHRGDLIIKDCGVRATERLSRGQLKLLVIAMKLVQVMMVSDDDSDSPVLLIDDIAAELDPEHRAVLLEAIYGLNTQIFVTTPQKELLDCTAWKEMKLFHVERGEIKEVV